MFFFFLDYYRGLVTTWDTFHAHASGDDRVTQCAELLEMIDSNFNHLRRQKYTNKHKAFSKYVAGHIEMFHWIQAVTGYVICLNLFIAFCRLSFSRKLMVVYDLRHTSKEDAPDFISLEPVPGFEWKSGFPFWHEILRREIKGMYFYEFLEPTGDNEAKSLLLILFLLQ